MKKEERELFHKMLDSYFNDGYEGTQQVLQIARMGNMQDSILIEKEIKQPSITRYRLFVKTEIIKEG